MRNGLELQSYLTKNRRKRDNAMAQKVGDIYTKIEFDELLDEADNNSDGTWEENFVMDIHDRYEEHGMKMFLSVKQNEILSRIANGD